MRTVPSLLSMLDDPNATPAPVSPIVMPWDYIRMRRLAAGLSIEQASRPFWHRPEHRADVERNMRQIEEVGFRVKRLWDMSRSYRLNMTVYRQLCDTLPESHPRLCLACGWDEWSTQIDNEGFDCTWSAADPEICTLCEQTKQARFKPRLANTQPHSDNHRASQRAA
ncbi:hypothetical protein [Novosphingobium sp. P6W]|uniref:hypothetical protein n=1 Tax=Novosphingobium sp. P6W TaxID=1609758 RepID=UPI0005C2A3B6|nr:hypothetical protein [Novosphingobium sp. P6W]AXB75449.1 hypothetical protein TQ38_002090 [Novosphingobium sp. P6W]KIS32520.1 hypothetical protein TQ38_09320 [Novosphingobium sp. P6W]